MVYSPSASCSWVGAAPWKRKNSFLPWNWTLLKCSSQVTLLTVVDMNKEINSFEQVSTGGYIPGELKEKSYQILLKLMPSIPKEIHVQAVVQIGNPAKNIVQYSEDHPTDLIIIGNRGLSGLKKILLGSVSNYVLLRSQVPILIMK